MPFDHQPSPDPRRPLSFYQPWERRPGPRRLRNPEEEASVARSWFRRPMYEADGYHFPDHPERPFVPW